MIHAFSFLILAAKGLPKSYMNRLELQERLRNDPVLGKITTIGVDPGTMSTGIARNSGWFVRIIVHRVLIATLARIFTLFWPSSNNALRTPARSAVDVVAAALTEDWGAGGLYLNGSEVSEVSEEARNPDKRTMVWRDSVRYTRLSEGETLLVQWK